jgi:uncharacterized protein
MEPKPVEAVERISSIDVLRGFALLGILVINIYTFAFPGIAMKNPPVAGGFTGLDFATWLVSHMVFYHKFMPIFSMLFGAGIVLLTTRLEEKGVRVRRIYYRRIFWLAVFGILHAYLLWMGDILFPYAICGAIVYLFRQSSVRRLLIIGIVGILVSMMSMHLFGRFFEFARLGAERAEIALAEGTEPSEMDEGLAQAWEQIRPGLQPTREELEKTIATYRDGYVGIVKDRAPQVVMMHTFAMLSFLVWRIGGLMLIGMALFKSGILSAARSMRFYAWMAVIFYAVGLTLVGSGAAKLIDHRFDFIYTFKYGTHFNAVGGTLVSCAHIAVVVMVCKAGVLAWLTRRFAAVGRMAFSNYISHTLICSTAFYGYGFGLFNRLGRFQLMGFVLAIWVVQIIVSPLWLRSFRFGPLEWLWRSLTYGKRQPFRVGVP